MLIGTALNRHVIKKLENEYPYIPRTSIYELSNIPVPKNFIINLMANGRPKPIEYITLIAIGTNLNSYL